MGFLFPEEQVALFSAAGRCVYSSFLYHTLILINCSYNNIEFPVQYFISTFILMCPDASGGLQLPAIPVFPVWSYKIFQKSSHNDIGMFGSLCLYRPLQYFCCGVAHTAQDVMRTGVSINRAGWLYKLDHRKLILIAFLARFIFAAMYDSYISVTDKEVLLPDSKFYSVRGMYIASFLTGYDTKSFANDILPRDRQSQYIFQNALKMEGGRIPLRLDDESTVFTYIIGIIYSLFGYFPLWVRIFNIALSIGSTYLLFEIARRHFGELAANLFLIVALFLPTQFIYSITLTRDFVRMFVITLILWVIYG